MNDSPSLGEMMAVWFAQMAQAIEALNQTMLAVLAELKLANKDKPKP